MVDARPDRKPREQWACFDDPVLMWRAIGEWAGVTGRTVLWTHNLGYDTRISEVFTQLPAEGWRLVQHNLTPRGMWLIWRRNRSTLVMVDSAAVFPTTLAAIGKAFGVGKLPLPDAGTGQVGLYSRCWRDVEILRTAVLAHLERIEREDLGNWQMTGAGQAWATFRHRFWDKRFVVHDDEEALTAERRAMWAGRCEAYWHGELSWQVVHEWDFSLAYGRIAQRTPVPVRLIGPMPRGFDWTSALDSGTTGILADCHVTTSVPVVPCSHDGRVVWPVGEFDTTLWDVEIKEVIASGGTVTVHRGWLYRKALALKPWADWCVETVERDAREGPSFVTIVAKHQMRALIGRFGMTHTVWDDFARSPAPEVRAYPAWDADTGDSFRVVHIGQSMWADAGQVEWQHSMPMVTGYIQAVGRVWLWRLLQECPPRAALYCDTDSVLTTDQHVYAMQAIADRHPEWGMRLKRSWVGFAVWGPRQIRTGPKVRVSGLPHDARATGRGKFSGEVWETLPGALSTGNADRVRVRARRWQISGVDHRRVGLGVGWTDPILLGGNSYGQ